MKRIGTLIVFIALSIGAFAQLPNKAKKMVGTWEYKLRSGFETIQLKGDELQGVGYRIDKLSGDTSRVENVRIARVDETLVYSLTNYNVVKGAVVPTVQKFVSPRKKLKFRNKTAPSPYEIKYSFGFLNKKKMFIRVYHGPEAKPVKLILTKKK